ESPQTERSTSAHTSAVQSIQVTPHSTYIQPHGLTYTILTPTVLFLFLFIFSNLFDVIRSVPPSFGSSFPSPIPCVWGGGGRRWSKCRGQRSGKRLGSSL
ncbi:hypothetical protein ANANG_G00132060, partial [Anguilla anguilla]